MNWLQVSSKLSCWYYRRQSIAFIEESLPPVHRSAMLSHLSGCPGCREEIRSLQGIMKSVRRSAPPVPRLDPDLWAKIEGKLQVVRPARSRRIGWGLPAASLASFAMAAAAYMCFGGSGHNSAMLHAGKRGGTVMAQLPAGAMSSEPHAMGAPASRTSVPPHTDGQALAASPAHKGGSPFAAREIAASEQSGMAPQTDEPVFAPASYGARNVGVTTSGFNRAKRPASALRSRSGAVSLESAAVSGWNGNLYGLNVGSPVVEAAPGENTFARGAERHFELQAKRYRVPRKLAFYEQGKSLQLENLRDAQVGRHDEISWKTGVKDRTAHNEQQPARVVTLASLPPEVITAVNGAVIAGDEMKYSRTAGAARSIDGSANLTVRRLNHHLSSTQDENDGASLDHGMALSSGGGSRGSTVERAPVSFFSQVQTVDSLGRPTATNRIIGQADPAGTVRFTASESHTNVGDQP